MQSGYRILSIKVLMVLLAITLINSKLYGADSGGQTTEVFYSVKNGSLIDILSDIGKRINYKIYYPPEAVDDLKSKRYTIKFRGAEIREVMNYLFNDITLWTYKMHNNEIQILRSIPIQAVDSLPNVQSVFGVIKDISGNVVPGATVKVKNSNKGTTTDNEGKFTLSNIQKGDRLIISSIGYQTKELTAGNQTVIAELNPFINNLNETQIVAYGSTTKRYNTGNVSTVKASEIKDLPVSNPLLALQGRVPGLEIQPANGLAGAGVSIRVQGSNSLTNGNDPLIIIDVIPYPSQTIPGTTILSNILGSNGGAKSYDQMGSPLSFLNTADIESIDVLKGADATSIYGSRGANGAIIISTKKGKAGKTSVTFNIQSGFKTVGKQLSLLNGSEYLSMRREAIKNDGGIVSPYDYDLNGTWDTTISHNWQKELTGGAAFNMTSNLSITGGSDNTKYLISGNYSKENYVYPQFFNKTNDTRGGVHFNISSGSNNNRFTIQFTGNYMYDNNQLPPSDYMPLALRLSPVAPSLLTPDGDINWVLNSAGVETYGNPISNSMKKYEIKSTSITSSINLSYEILPSLKASAVLGYTSINSRQMLTTPLTSIPPSSRNFGVTNSLDITNNKNEYINIEPMLEYGKTFGESKLNFLVGTTITNNKSIFDGVLASGFSSDLLIEDLASATAFSSANSGNNIYRYNAAFGRVTYHLKDKYLIQLSGRRDGSSRFGSENQFHNFGSIAAAWIFSEEKFIKNSLPFLNFGKIRSSYGTSGNDQIGDYRFLTLYQSTYNPRPYQGIPALVPSGLSNPFLQWESIKKWDIALETGFLDQRLSLNINYALNRSSNQLMTVSLPYTTGFDNISLNLGAKVQNKSWEFALTSINIKSPRITWLSTVNLTILRSKLLEFPGLDQSPFAYKYIVGKSPNIQQVYKYAGLNDTTGIFQFYNKKGEITTTPDVLQDRTSTINTDSKFNGGFINTFTYGNLSLNISLSFDKRFILIQYPPDQPGTFLYTVPPYMLDRWKNPGDKATYQKYTASSQNFEQYINYTVISDQSFQDVYYIRCNNLTLNYEFPDSWKRAIGASMFNVYIQTLNPFIITNFKKGLDPQTQNSLPQLKTFNLGIKGTF
ncbi:TonB-linked SusC/RagA family outer membrane protein [Chitinophaga terrae (ex Kim and Jung 2007)]|uniref:SusC/RagA family TonB-linked outer membrane protein n=1 Tax=Chitinophaga terrae (ex Kim and Jung 2007) TaxID=408074 RepID=UPI002785B239|nr:SusC/RagA family TonB-linked outer membrane protein [Chitinophaga terrae (ex Kim and Jung 2007)]MDQ0106852.1 TonB-linked SusC/RagA family outer membrane protein [Chitinophaga terrae (ex Kim and Jung 2007)]